MTAAGPLRQRLLNSGMSLAEATVLSKSNDPYRVDTPAGHRDGKWLAEQFDRAIGGERRIHLRGLHYALLGVLKPDQSAYANDDPTWSWLAGPAKAARFLGYVPFARLFDARNSPPVINIVAEEDVETWVTVGLDVDIPDMSDLEPQANVSGFEGRQAYHLVIFGEKTSLADVVLPVAERFQADVFLPSGEISDTLLFEMAAAADADGRPMIVFTLSDCDPSGHQMPVSIGRKLQALRDLMFPDLEFEVRTVALTVEQVRGLGLPSTPLKQTERRASRWMAAFGVEQTEIDALGTLRPDVLEEILVEAMQPYFDNELAYRVYVARREWQASAQYTLDEQMDPDTRDELRDEAAELLEGMSAEIEALNQKMRLATGDRFLLPPPMIPSARPERMRFPGKPPLISSAWEWGEQTRALKAHKAYDEEGPNDC